MKKILIISFLCLLSSCTVCKINNEYIKVYKQDRSGEVLPTYLIIKPYNKTYELYFSSNNYSVLGKYELKGDTLCLTPKYDHRGEIVEINSEISIDTIPILLKVQGENIEDITKYENYPELAIWFKNGSLYKFHQIK